MSLKCVVIDDESLAIDVLENYISRVPSLTLEATFNNGIDALSYLHLNHIDILFIDIQMPDMNGMEFLRLLNKKVNIVFTSAYPQYALEGYDFQPLDFLIKPISFDKFMRAVGRVKILYNPVVEENDTSGLYFYIKSGGKTVRLLLSDIYYIEGLKDYVIFYTSEKKYISLQTMKELVDKLSENQFIRIHKSYIVNSNKIEEMSRSKVLLLGREIPVGRQYKEAFLKSMENKKP